MGKYLSLVGGIIAIALGVLGIIEWWDPEIIGFLKGMLVIILTLGGALAFFVGVGEIKDSLSQKKASKK